MTSQVHAHFPKLRRYRRRSFETTVAVMHKGRFLFESTMEIGAGGVLLRSDKPYRKGEGLELSFVLSGQTTITALAEVVYLIPSASEYRVGVKFLPATPEFAKLQGEIERFVERST